MGEAGATDRSELPRGRTPAGRRPRRAHQASSGLSGQRFRTPTPGVDPGGSRRFPVIVAVVGLLAAGGLADRVVGGPTSSGPVPAVSSDAVSVVAPGSALSSSWFCGGATDTRKGRAPGQLVVTNAGTSAVSGTATIMGSNGKRAVVPLRAPAESHTTVAETVPGGAPWVGATVELQGGQAVVDQQIGGTLGASTTPCATTGSRSWYFTSGATLVNAGVELILVNPYPIDAIADLTFTTDQGVEQPGDFQGLVVPARGMLAVDLGSHLRRRQRIATTVSVVTGRIVAWKTDVVTPPAKGQVTLDSPNASSAPDPAAPIGGVAVTLGSPSAGTDWTWPEGDSGNGFNEQYTVYNPGSATANVALTIGLDAGTAQPFDLSVAPDSVSTVVSASAARIPAGVGHFAQVQSTNGVPVVAERTLAVGTPSAISGLGELPGIRVSTPQWLIGAAATATGTRGYLVIQNPGTRPATISVEGIANGHTRSLAGFPALTLGPDHRTSILMNKYGPAGEALLVKGSAPIVVERDLYGTGKSHSVSLSPGAPFSTNS